MARFSAHLAGGAGSGYISIGRPSDMENAMVGQAISVHCWANVDRYDAQPVMVGKDNGSNSTSQFCLYVHTDGKVRARIGDGGQVTCIGATTITTDVWKPYGLQYDGLTVDQLAVWYDGVRDGTASSTKSITAKAANMELFRGFNTNSARLSGYLADVAIWNVTLTDNEFRALARGISPLMIRRQSLQGFWPLWGVAYNEPDLSGLDNDGSAVATNPSQANHPSIGRMVA